MRRKQIENLGVVALVSAGGIFVVLALIGNRLGMATTGPVAGGTVPLAPVSATSAATPAAITATRLDFSGTAQQATRQFFLQAGLARFEVHHAADNYFSAWLMDNQGKRVELVASNVGRFDGSKAVGITQSGSYLLDVTAFGPWSVTVTQ